jgi:hypothetical protein
MKKVLIHAIAILFSLEAFAQLPLFVAKSAGTKYVDWGKQPEEPAEGPADTWTFTHQMCGGPSEEGVKASSTLAPQGKKNYYPVNICDDNPTTAWVEGHPDYGIGEYLELRDWSPMGNGEISILNGYQSSRQTWENNSRVKKLKISYKGKDYCVIELADKMGTQHFSLPKQLFTLLEIDPSPGLRLTIMEVYPGLKYKDTAISGIFSCGG